MSLRRRLALCLVSLAAIVAAYAQDASLVASVDRDRIQANESFTYVLRVEGRFSGRPDLSALGREFDVLRSGSSQSIQIVNGQTTQVAEWTVELMPRGAGEFELPPIELGGELSNPVQVEVLPAETATDAAADIFIEVELDRDEAYVQSQVIYTQRFFIGIPTGRESFPATAIAGGEAIAEKLGNDREYQTVRGDRVYRVRERKFAVFPQATGMLRIGPAEYEATVIPNRGFSRRQVLRSDVVELTVLPAVAPPASHPNAVWLPARSLRLEEAWNDGEDVFEQGVPRTREVSVQAEGVLETQLPELALAEGEGLRQYPDQPELSRELTDAGIEARRTERFAVIAQQPGTVEFPPVELPWWNVDLRRWEIARIDAVTIPVEPGDETVPAALATPAAAPVVETDPGFWPWVSGALAAGWLLTIAAWAFSRRATRRSVRPRPAERAVSARSLLKQALAACRVDDAARTRDLLLEWAARQFPDDPPLSLGALAGRLADPLAAEIRTLESSLYGPQGHAWRGRKLAELLSATQSVSREGTEEGRDPLMPLYR
ncbi:MAG TPA: BatD family protein [Gammaproteobacteria bacterium]|nr:BatD family protein [Gammaproteobacteria bacterium]